MFIQLEHRIHGIRKIVPKSKFCKDNVRLSIVLIEVKLNMSTMVYRFVEYFTKLKTKGSLGLSIFFRNASFLVYSILPASQNANE